MYVWYGDQGRQWPWTEQCRSTCATSSKLMLLLLYFAVREQSSSTEIVLHSVAGNMSHKNEQCLSYARFVLTSKIQFGSHRLLHSTSCCHVQFWEFAPASTISVWILFTYKLFFDYCDPLNIYTLEKYGKY